MVVLWGSFWSDSHIQVSEASDRVLFILDQRPSSVRSCSRALDLCARRLRIAVQCISIPSIIFVQNMRYFILTIGCFMYFWIQVGS